MLAGRGSAGDDCGGGGCWVCPLGLPRALSHCGVLVRLSGIGRAAFGADAGLHQVWGPQGKQLTLQHAFGARWPSWELEVCSLGSAVDVPGVA